MWYDWFDINLFTLFAFVCCCCRRCLGYQDSACTYMHIYLWRRRRREMWLWGRKGETRGNPLTPVLFLLPLLSPLVGVKRRRCLSKDRGGWSYTSLSKSVFYFSKKGRWSFKLVNWCEQCVNECTSFGAYVIKSVTARIKKKKFELFFNEFLSPCHE